MKFTDQTGRHIILHARPERIVSVVPSQTELLYTLGLNKEVIALTKFCVHPQEWFRHKKRIGGTKTLHISEILNLRPDLILANKEENDREQIEKLAEEVPVWISDVKTWEDALRMIVSVGELTGRGQEAARLGDSIAAAGKSLQKEAGKKGSALYLIWYDPLMAAGGDTFISSMMDVAGLTNVLRDESRYPVVSVDEIVRHKPDFLLLSSEPYPFTEKHAEEFRKFLPSTRVLTVDGQFFSWYGSRMLDAIDYFRALLPDC